MRVLHSFIIALVFAPMLACSGAETSENDANTEQADTSTEVEASDTQESEAPQEEDAATSETDTAEEEGLCALPCLNEFDQSDKKLCPDPKSDWSCEEGCCQPVFRCAEDADCTTQGFDEGQCDDPALPCLCEVESGACYSATCSAANQCGEGLICASGSCASMPEESAVTLRMLTRQGVLMPGASLALRIDGGADSNADLRFAVEVTWTSDDESVVSVNDEGVATGGDTAGDATLKATHAGGATASITLRNVVPNEEDTLTLVALREGTLMPATGHFALVDSESGESIASGTLPESGTITTTHEASAGIDVHIFAEGHEWVSHLNVSSARLFVPLTPTMWGAISMTPDGELNEESELVGATVVEGAVDMVDYQKAGEVELSLSALPFGASLFDFNLESILGASVKRFFHPDTALPGVDTTETLEMPGGLTFAFAGPAVPTYVLAVPPGESRLWTLGGRIGIDEVFAFSDDIFEAFGGGTVNFGQIASYLMPFFTEFWSGLSETPSLTLDADTIHSVDTKLQTAMALHMELDVPTLPSLGELGWAATVIAIGGAMTGDELFYPLGLAAAGDTSDDTKWPADGQVDAFEETPEIEPLALSMAPLYGALAGPHSSYTTALVALSIRDNGDDPRPEGGSAIFDRQSAGSPYKKNLKESSFLPFSFESSWAEDTRVVSAETLEGVDTIRLLIKGRSGDNWTLWLNGKENYAVPTPSELIAELEEDRAADPLSVVISHFDFVEALDLETLRLPDAPNLQDLLHQVERTSFVEL